MTRKKGVKKADEWRGFVNYHLPVDVKKAAGDYRKTWDLLGDILPTLVGARYKLSLSFNPQDDAVIASVTCKDPENVNYQRTLTAFGPDVHEAILRLSYIHFVVFQEVWPDDNPKGDEGW